MNRSILRSAALTGMLALAACSKAPAPRPEAASVTVSGSDVDAVQAMLMHGDRKAGAKALKPLLKREPMNPRLALLQESLSGNAQEQLGPANYPYTVRAGESIEAIAERLLGNRYKAYQLARYNELSDPSTVAAGMILRIPGAPPRPRPQPAERRPRPVPAPVASKKKLAVPVAAAPAKPAADPAAAQRARSAGLASLNRGAVQQAVGLLQRANALDPGNAVILRDLQRAQRIAATVRARQ